MKNTLPILLCTIFFYSTGSSQKIVIIGSSTASGYGASNYIYSWAGRLQQYYRKNTRDGRDTAIINLARTGGVTSYSGMPTGYKPPANRPLPDTNSNITKALTYHPNILIISFPSNDAVKSYSVQETIDNFLLMANLATQAGVKCFVTTSQPRDSITSFALKRQIDLRDTVLKIFGHYALNFWDSIVTNDGHYNIIPALAFGDLVHLNDKGHAVLFRQVIAKNIFDTSTIAEPSPIKITHSAIKCYGGYSTVIINASFGTAPYRYSINGTNYQTSDTFSIKTGTYTIYIKDAKGNLVTTKTFIPQPPAFLFSASVKPVSCYGGNDGAMQIKYSGGSPSYAFRLDSFAYVNDSIARNVHAGSYTVTVKDANGCTNYRRDIVVSQPEILTAQSKATGILCYNGTALLTTTSTGGTGSKLFSLDGISYHTSSTIAVKAGIYNIVVKDAKGCIAKSNTVNVMQPQQVTVTTLSETNTSCNGSDGSITLAASGGTSPYQYSIDDITYQSSGMFNNLKAGKYTFRVIDKNSCKTYYTATIAQSASCLNTLDSIITVYPNPSASNFSVINKNENAGPVQINIYNIYGQKVFNIKTGDVITKVGSSLKPGTYVMRVSNGALQKSFKLIKTQ